MAGKNGKTRPFTSVNYSAARLARERQRREYEQRKKEKLIFALFVVIILVMILFAILIFKKVLGDGAPNETDTETAAETAVNGTETGDGEADAQAVANGAYRNEVLARSDIYTGVLILIDPSHPYRATEDVDLEEMYPSRTPFENANTKSGIAYSYYSADSNQLLESETLKAFNAFTDAFYKATGNYDLYTHTKATYVKGADDDHATGRAVDLSVYTAAGDHYSLDDPKASDDFEWIMKNYYKYGFICLPADDCASGTSVEPYHFLYVGIPHAYYMHKNDLDLEEYWELLRSKHAFSGDGKNALAFTAEDGSRYEVYYVAAAGDMVSVPVPTDNSEYTISGDNVGGFAVTVKLP